MKDICGCAIYALARHASGDIIVVLPNKIDPQLMAESLSFFMPAKRIITLPPWDCMPHENTSPSSEAMSMRIEAMTAMLEPNPKAIITDYYALVQKLPPTNIVPNLQLKILPNQTTRRAILSFLQKTGFYACDIASNPGEFAERASIIDIISGHNAFRLDFDFDTVERIRIFDINTQNSIGETQDATIYGASEIIDDGSIAIRQLMADGVRRQGLEQHLTEIYKNPATITDYLPNATLFTIGQSSIRDEFIYKKLADSELSCALYTEHDEAEKLLARGSANMLRALTSLNFKPAHNFYAEAPKEGIFAAVGQALSGEFAQKKALICCSSQGSCSRVISALESHGIKAQRVQTIDEVDNAPTNIGAGTISVAAAPIDSGFYEGQYCIISEKEIFGRVTRVKHYTKKSQLLLSAFNPNDIVVHENYGIGRFLGLQSVMVNNRVRDFIALAYADDAKLMIPVENINLITRYGRANDAHTILDKLGGAGWQSRKTRLRRKIYEISKSLIEVAAHRQEHRTEPIYVDPLEFDRFCMRFPYVETSDQAEAINDVLGDLKSGILMDRLICGEAGFGKTEVAMRAAYAVVHSNHYGERSQVAVLVPSTILCTQQFRVFKERFDDCIIEHVSGINSPKHNSDIKQKLADGNIDIIIGTHTLLADSTKFKNLRLLIIDEEQSFGVKQKERLKAMYPSIHVLMLSATPIPRTLYMSLAGIRDMSIIATPPIHKADVDTIIAEYDEQTIVNAIMREIHRRGQVFYVCPKIQHLNQAIERLATLFPDLKIAKAHGQMPNAELTTAMNDFYNGKCDILVSTTVVESGLNIPNANTIIIENVQHLGVSQLCQLRGRVGRHKSRGYAYMMLPSTMADAEKAWYRVSILKNVNSGLAIASHDMDERGFGNVLGNEQAGNIKEIGIELYQKTLEEMIEELKNNKAAKINPEINLGIAVSIPKSYVADDGMRLIFYRRAAEIETDEQLEVFGIDLIDRFGELPTETACLITILKLKIACRTVLISKVVAQENRLIISFFNNTFANPEGLIRWAENSNGTAKITPKQELVIKMLGKENPVDTLSKALNEIASLSKGPRHN